jgi:hypothetical protein
LIDFLQIVGTTGGILGALLVCLKRPWVGHIVWLLANACWMIYGRLSDNNYLFVLFTVYWLLALIGCYNYRPRKTDERQG